jgi:hypothetical protein
MVPRFRDELQAVFIAAHPGVDVKVDGFEEAEGVFFEEDLDSGGVMVVIEEGDGFADEGDRGFEETAV